ELELFVRRVPDAYRLRSTVALQVIQSLLGKFVPAVDSVHHLQGAVGLHFMAAGVQKRYELRGLIGKADAQQAVNRERGVANPTIAIVPIAFAFKALGKTARRRGNNGAGRFVSQ